MIRVRRMLQQPGCLELELNELMAELSTEGKVTLISVFTRTNNTWAVFSVEK